jgi:hypothetical protein
MDLTNDEFKSIKRENQRMKSITAQGATGQVTTLWKDGIIERIYTSSESIPAKEGRVELKNIDVQSEGVLPLEPSSSG